MLQLAMKSASSPARLARQAGSGAGAKSLPPVYSPRDSSLRFTSLLIDDGTAPVRRLPKSCSSSRLTNCPIASGMGPDKPHRQMHRRRRVVNPHSCIGIEPFKSDKLRGNGTLRQVSLSGGGVGDGLTGWRMRDGRVHVVPGMVASSIMRR